MILCLIAYDIYDFRYCARSNENRWNIAGEPTLYLAKEKDVILAEYARHFFYASPLKKGVGVSDVGHHLVKLVLQMPNRQSAAIASET